MGKENQAPCQKLSMNDPICPTCGEPVEGEKKGTITHPGDCREAYYRKIRAEARKRSDLAKKEGRALKECSLCGKPFQGQATECPACRRPKRKAPTILRKCMGECGCMVALPNYFCPPCRARKNYLAQEYDEAALYF